MRIIFLCGCLQEDCDGVGDYTRSLAGELARQGHAIKIISLFDRHVMKPVEGKQKDNGTCFEFLRLPRGGTAQATLVARKSIERFKPDWISLQFVPSSFHPKGLPFFFPSTLRMLASGFKLHIMFHELWVGVNGMIGFRKQVMRAVQRLIVYKILKATTPDCITTTIPLYQRALSNSIVKMLPLFGNIPVVPCKSIRSDGSKLVVVHFGTFTEALKDFEEQLTYTKRLASRIARRIEFKVFGDGGRVKHKALELARSILGAHCIKDLGRVSRQEVSLLLQSADMGISRADALLYGKSGSTIAMLEHGLPVLLRGKQFYPRGSRLLYSSQLVFCDSASPEGFCKVPAKRGLPRTATSFLGLLATDEQSVAMEEALRTS